jgi:hypothetical protein
MASPLVVPRSDDECEFGEGGREGTVNLLGCLSV